MKKKYLEPEVEITKVVLETRFLGTLDMTTASALDPNDFEDD